MNKDVVDYTPLTVDDGNLENGNVMLPAQSKRTTAKLSRRDWVFVVVILFQMAVIALLASARLQRASVAADVGYTSHEPLWYSPASEVLEEQVKVFDDSFIVQSIYQETTPEADKAWKDLYYDHARIRIPREQAARLVNKTWPIKDDPGYYITALDVFHQLHCLDEVRQAINNMRYIDDMGKLGPIHISHCIDSLRQYIMCHADVTTMAWQWDSKNKIVRPQLSAPHTCVNFEKIRDWAIERKLKEWISEDEYIDDGIPWPPAIHDIQDAYSLPTPYAKQ